jgi:hypothetical protein
MVLGAILVIFGRRFTLWSLRPYFSKQRLAELDQPDQRRLRMFVNFSRGDGRCHRSFLCRGRHSEFVDIGVQLLRGVALQRH